MKRKWYVKVWGLSMQTLEYSKRIETTLDPIHKNKILVSMLIFALISLASDNLDFLNDYLIQFLFKTK
jgi:hypothetical protein